MVAHNQRGRAQAILSRSAPFVLALLALALLLAGFPERTAPSVPAHAFTQLSGNALPLSFVPNRGQAGEDVRFIVHSFSGTIQFFPDRIRWSLPLPSAKTGTTAVWLDFLGAEGRPEIQGEGSLPGVVNYLIGNDAGRWLTGLPTYEGLVYAGVYPGIDLHFEGRQDVAGPWALKGTYTVSPGADPGLIRWRYGGASNVRIQDGTGDLRISVGIPGSPAQQVLVEHAPVAWQVIDGQRHFVNSGYRIDAGGALRFSLGAYNPSHPLVIDPTLSFSTYLGGGLDDYGHAIAVDREGQIYVAGYGLSVDFPTTPNALQSTSSGGTCISPPPFNIPFPCSDGFLSKISADGSTLLYSTYLGGTEDDGLRAIALGESGDIYLTGWTTSTDFPVVNPIQPALGGLNRTPDAFIARLSADGSALEYSTYLGGSARDYGDNLALDGSGNAYIVGWTESTNFPTENAIQPSYGGGFFDGFVAKINAAGSAYVYSTYLGGNDLEYSYGIDADDAGHAYISGFTLSSDFPIFNALQPVFGGGIEAYVTKLLPDGSAYDFSTYFGADDTRSYDIRVSDGGSIYLVGVTSSQDFPLVNPLQGTYGGGPYDAFVSRFSSDGSTLDFSTYLGGEDHEVLHTLALDGGGNLFFTGWSTSPNFPLSDPLQNEHAGGNDMVVGMIGADLSDLDFSTYLGGTNGDLGYSIAVDGSGSIYVTGYTTSADFPVLDPLQPAPAGDTDGFLVKIDLGQPQAPQAGFISSSPDELGMTTVFTNTSTGPNLGYLWDFGDGSPVVTQTNPTHAYAAAGTYTVELTATNGAGSDVAVGIVEITKAQVKVYLPVIRR